MDPFNSVIVSPKKDRTVEGNSSFSDNAVPRTPNEKIVEKVNKAASDFYQIFEMNNEKLLVRHNTFHLI
jgi:hypothetical protein